MVGVVLLAWDCETAPVRRCLPLVPPRMGSGRRRRKPPLRGQSAPKNPAGHYAGTVSAWSTSCFTCVAAHQIVCGTSQIFAVIDDVCMWRRHLTMPGSRWRWHPCPSPYPARNRRCEAGATRSPGVGTTWDLPLRGFSQRGSRQTKGGPRSGQTLLAAPNSLTAGIKDSCPRAQGGSGRRGTFTAGVGAVRNQSASGPKQDEVDMNTLLPFHAQAGVRTLPPATLK